ncbi:MAG: sensor histidine kinase, partial [Armatimonadetes bacterium]|nr:sensor histidine kinase [Armatimonadota bacterium]
AEVSITVFREPQGGRDMGIVVVRDLTEALRVEEERAVRERQLGLMLREAHHRIKNNLQVASDLLALQAAAETPACREALGAAARRIRALAAVHEGIRADQDVTEVQAGPLIRALAQDLQTSRQGVRFEVTVDERPVTSRAASALALITAELVSNALHHGAPTAVHVCFRVTDGEALLEVRDDGASELPLPGPQDGKFGLRLVGLLAEEQLGGDFSLLREQGCTVARARFPLAAPTD